MKAFLRSFLFSLLRFLARARLSRMGKPVVIGVTGSLGKTTTKDAIFHVLSKRYKVLKSDKSYNTEWGLPMTLLGVTSPGSSIVGWMKLLVRSFRAAFFSKEHFDFIVLEMGVDKKGDMDILLSVVKPQIAVFTAVAPVHMADGQFADLGSIYEEKAKLIHSVPAAKDGGIVFLNAENDFLRSKNPDLDAKIVWYGDDAKAKLLARNIKMESASLETIGLSFEACYGDVCADFSIPILGKQHISNLLPAIGCGLLQGLYMDDIVSALRDFHLPPGRLNPIPGIRESLIIDSSYNASPVATQSALQTLREISAERKIFVFGNMNELGSGSEKAHRDIAQVIAGAADILVTVGDQAAFTADEVLQQKILTKEAVHSFLDIGVARDFVKGIIQKGDVILVKGSQNKVRLEKLVKYIMQEPAQAKELLVRQDGIWEDA